MVQIFGRLTRQEETREGLLGIIISCFEPKAYRVVIWFERQRCIYWGSWSSEERPRDFIRNPKKSKIERLKNWF